MDAAIRDERSSAALGLSAVFLNTSLNRDPGLSHTRRLMEMSETILAKAGAAITHIHVAGHDVPAGIFPDMTEHGFDTDEWPEIWAKISSAEIIVVGTPIWLGQESSLCRKLIERLYAMSGQLNNKGQSIFYGKVGGAMITGNEDGLKHCAANVLYALQHLGCLIPPQADCGWIGDVGPGPSFGDQQDSASPVGFDSDFTQKNTTIMTWNLIHAARMLKDAGGLPSYGNDRNAWKNGHRFGFELPQPLAD